MIYFNFIKTKSMTQLWYKEDKLEVNFIDASDWH